MNVAVVEHKTASTQLATVSFTDTEYEEKKNIYQRHRPTTCNRYKSSNSILKSKRRENI